MNGSVPVILPTRFWRQCILLITTVYYRLIMTVNISYILTAIWISKYMFITHFYERISKKSIILKYIYIFFFTKKPVYSKTSIRLLFYPKMGFWKKKAILKSIKRYLRHLYGSHFSMYIEYERRRYYYTVGKI